VECRAEEYPLSRAFLTLLDSLCAAAPLPRTLGAGTRPPGLDPYVEHALNRLALAAPHRPYSRPHEKWQVLAISFRLFARWLEQYEPTASDFPPAGREPDVNPPPGFRLLLQLHSQSEFLRLTLTTLDEAHELMDRHTAPEHVSDPVFFYKQNTTPDLPRKKDNNMICGSRDSHASRIGTESWFNLGLNFGS
ncbi:jg25559, partial [Pararge aegeria aegeria]